METMEKELFYYDGNARGSYYVFERNASDDIFIMEVAASEDYVINLIKLMNDNADFVGTKGSY